jgi:hypothetical protein
MVLVLKHVCKILFFNLRQGIPGSGHEHLCWETSCCLPQEGGLPVISNCACFTALFWSPGLGQWVSLIPLHCSHDLKYEGEDEAEGLLELLVDKSWPTSKGLLAYQPSQCPHKAICSLLSCIINLISVIAPNYVISVNTWRIPQLGDVIR